MELECGCSPKQSQSYLLAPPYQHWPGKVAVGNVSLGKNTAVRRSCFLPHSTDIDYKLLHTHTNICTHFPSPHPSPPSLWRVCGQCREWLRDRMAACWSWITSPVAKCVYGLCAFAEVFFSCSHTVLPKEHSLGVIFFLLTFLLLCCNFLQFPVFLSCLPPCDICMLCMGRLMAYFTGTQGSRFKVLYYSSHTQSYKYNQ